MCISRRNVVLGLSAVGSSSLLGAETKPSWPAFRGPGGNGVSDGYSIPTTWNADAAEGKVAGIKWRTPIPGLGHSSPIVIDDRIYVCTAVRKAPGKAPLKLAVSGEPTAANDDDEQSWVVLCFDSRTGKEIWQKTARMAKPRATRHEKATHANTTLATDGKRLVAFFGSEGMFCFDLNGKLLWTRDLGVINISKYGIGWGYGSSPAIHENRIAIVCDDPANPFVAVLSLEDGKELWRASRKGICERSLGTPFIHAGKTAVQVVVNGWPFSMSYDLETGKELWRLSVGGDNPIPTPFAANGWIYLTNAHGGKAPVFAIRPEARGDISIKEGTTSNEGIVWFTPQSGSYISTPVVYGDYIYLGNTNGVVRCLNAKTGEKIYEERVSKEAQIYASLVAADGKIFCPSLDGDVYVLKAGPKFELLARNHMGEACFATPAITKNIICFRTTESLIAVG